MTDVFVFDVEGLGLECRWNANLPIYFVGILTIDDNSCKRIHRHYNLETAIDHIRDLLRRGWLGIAHNAKFDLCTLNTRGLNHTIEKGILSLVCTMVMAYSRESNLPSYSLDALTGMKTDVVQTAIDSGLLDASFNKRQFWNTDWRDNQQMIEHIADYCVSDLKATWTLYKRLVAWYNREEHDKFRQTLIDLEFPMLSVLAHMERVGFGVDTNALQLLTEDTTKELKEHEATMALVSSCLPCLSWDKEEEEFVPKAVEYKKKPYNNKGNIRHYMDKSGVVIASTPSVAGDHCEVVSYNSAAATGHTYWLLKRECPEVLERAEATPKGKPKLNKDFFADVAEELPENLPIAKYLKAKKNTQICHSIAEHVRDGRIHSSFNNCLTRTGRLSSSQPNLQNISRPDKEPTSISSRFRQLFSASPGKCILVADLDRIEICVLAWYLLVAMKDHSLADVCNTPGSDVHQSNADKWGLSRIVAKTLIFLLVYGGGAGLIFRRGMAKTIEEAEVMVAEVDRTQPSINKLKKSVWQRCKDRGYITNPFNCRGVYPELYSKQKWIVGRGERQSFNYLIQRTARDVLQLLVIDSFGLILKHGGILVNIVHDEVIIECDLAVADALMHDLNKVWNNRQDILPGVTINGEWNKGDNWYAAKT